MLRSFLFKIVFYFGLSVLCIFFIPSLVLPKKAVAFFMGLWFLSSTVAHYIAGALAKLTTSDTTTESTGILGDLNNMLFSNIDPMAKGVAEAMIYNDLFGKIGFVTIGIALITLVISPVIKKLMHDVH